MPRLSDSMEEGVIVSWLVENGTEVSAGDELAEIETDKATMVYEADGGGLVRTVAEAGDTLPVGAPIARLLEPGEDPGPEPEPASPAAEVRDDPAGESSPPNAPASAVAAVLSATGRGASPKASPLARRMARELSVDLAELDGSGPGGRVVKLDVERAAASHAGEPDRADPAGTPESGRGEEIELNRLQATVARRMTESKATIPHFYLRTSVGMDRCAEERTKLKEQAAAGAVVPSFNDMVVKAVALALREHPKLNGSFTEGRIQLHAGVNVGIAVAAEGALIVPVIADADRLGLSAIAARSRQLADAVRGGTVTPPELSGGTFTVSNLGMFGVGSFDAVINPGQAAILAVGAVESRPVVRDGSLVAAKMMDLTLSCDHRIVYGAEGAEFLRRVRNLLEVPLSLAL